MASIDVTGAQAQSIMTSLGNPQIVYCLTSIGATEVFSFVVLSAAATDLVFYPKKADGTYILESTLKSAFPSALLVNYIA